MRIKIVFMVLLSFSVCLSAANISPNSGTAGYAFLKMPVGVRAQSMGENFVAVADDVSTIFYNPTGLLRINNIEVSAEHILWFDQISKSNINFVYPKTIIGPVGVGINYVSVPYEKRESENDENYQSASVWMGVFQIAWAKTINNKLSVGFGLKYINENLDTQSTTGIAIDLGGIYNLKSSISVGVAIQNLGAQLTNENPDQLPAVFRTGVAKRFLKEKLLLASDLNYGFVDGTASFGIGAEYLLSKYFCPRIGYKYLFTNNNLDFISGLNVGFGIRYKKFGLDYSFSPKIDLGLVHLVSFSAKF